MCCSKWHSEINTKGSTAAGSGQGEPGVMRENIEDSRSLDTGKNIPGSRSFLVCPRTKTFLLSFLHFGEIRNSLLGDTSQPPRNPDEDHVTAHCVSFQQVCVPRLSSHDSLVKEHFLSTSTSLSATAPATAWKPESYTDVTHYTSNLAARTWNTELSTSADSSVDMHSC